MIPCENKLSVTVGTVPPSLVVPSVKSTGPMPRIPSWPYRRQVSLTGFSGIWGHIPLKPVDCDATPIDWPVMVADPSVTSSVTRANTIRDTLSRFEDINDKHPHSSPEKLPLPYCTDTVDPVSLEFGPG